MDIQEFIDAYRYFKVGGTGRTAIYANLRKRQELHDRLYWVDLAGKGDPKDDLLRLDPTHFTSPFLIPRGRLMVDYPVNRIAMDKFTVKQEAQLKGPSGLETKKSATQANLVEKWCAAQIDNLALQVRQVTKGICKDGESYLKQILDPKIIMEQEKYKGNPFSWKTPSSRMVYASLDLDKFNRPHEVYEDRVITARMARQIAKDLNDGQKVSVLPDIPDHVLVILVEFWAQEWRGYMAVDQQYQTFDAIPMEGEQVTKNFNGFAPYVRGFTGFGEESLKGDPADQAVGILTGWDRAILAEARALTITDTMLAKHAAPTPVREWEPGFEPPADDKLSLAVGDVVDAVNFKFHYDGGPPLSPVLLEMQSKLDRMFEAFQPGSVSGAIGGKNEPAVGRNILISQANMQNTPIYIAVKTMLANDLGMALETVEKVIKSGVEIRGYVLKPTDINGNYKVEVAIRNGNPDERIRNLLAIKDLWDIFSHEFLLQELGDISDTTTEMAKQAAQKFVDTLIASPLGFKLFAERLFKELDDQDSLDLLKAQESGIPQTASPMEGQPSGDASLGLVGVGGSPTRGVAPLPQNPAINAVRQMGGMNAG